MSENPENNRLIKDLLELEEQSVLDLVQERLDAWRFTIRDHCRRPNCHAIGWRKIRARQLLYFQHDDGE